MQEFPHQYRVVAAGAVEGDVDLERGMPSSDGATTPIDVADEARPADQRLIDASMDGRLRDALKKLPPSYRMKWKACRRGKLRPSPRCPRRTSRRVSIERV